MVSYIFFKNMLQERRAEILYDIEQTKDKLEEYKVELEEVEQSLKELEEDKHKFL